MEAASAAEYSTATSQLSSHVSTSACCPVGAGPLRSVADTAGRGTTDTTVRMWEMRYYSCHTAGAGLAESPEAVRVRMRPLLLPAASQNCRRQCGGGSRSDVTVVLLS